MPFLYDVLHVKPQLYVKDKFGHGGGGGGGGKNFSKTFFLFPIC